MLKWWRCCKGGLCCTPLPAPPKKSDPSSTAVLSQMQGCAFLDLLLGERGENAIKGFRWTKEKPPPPKWHFWEH